MRYAPSAHARVRRPGAAGLTLIEILAVITLIAIVIGLGLGAITRLDLGENVGLSVVQNGLRAARNWAVAQRSPARVRIDVAGGKLRPEGLQVVGTWRFESEAIEGALELDGVGLGGELVADGFRGKALSFVRQPPRSRVEFPLQHDPACRLDDGFRIACAVRTEEDGSGTLLEFGESIGIETGSDGSIAGWIVPATVDERGETMRGGKHAVRSGPHVLRPGRWSEVTLAYDRVELALEVDGVVVALRRDEKPVWPAEGPLVLSPGNQAWPGTVDDLVVAVVVPGDDLPLPKNIRFVPGTPAEVRFVASGELDREKHAEPVTITIELGDGRTQKTVVNLFGTVE